MHRFHNALLVFIITGSFFILNQAQAASNDIIINEIGAFPTSTHEWVEIWNSGTEPIDLNGWKFWENTTNHGLTATTTDTIMAPGEYGAICQNSAAFLLDHPAFSGSIFGSSWSSLNEGGEEIGLKDSAGNVVEKFTYLPATNHSLERKNPFIADYSANNWQEHTAGDTLGFQNSDYAITTEVATTTTSTPPTDTTTTPYALLLTPSTSSLWAQIKINEFLPDPESGDEWIELYNLATTSLDLAAGSLCDSRQTSCLLVTTSGTIAAQGWATFFLNGSHLNNDGDSIILKSPDDITLDQIAYGTAALAAPEKGQAVARKSDGVDTDLDTDWALTTLSTPGAANTIVVPTPPPPAPNGGGGSSGGSSIAVAPASVASTQNKEKSSTSTIKNTAKGPSGDQTKIIWKLSGPRGAAPQENITLSAAGSADPRGGSLLMSWNLGDGAVIDGQTVTHHFNATGTYHVIVYATSTQGTAGQQAFPLIIAPGLTARPGGVVISELFPNPLGSDQGEFIELYNSTSSSVSLASWKLETGDGKSFTIPDKTTVRPNESLVFYRAATHLVLGNAKETVLLKTPDDVIIDHIAYDVSEPGHSLSLSGGTRKWVATITPGFVADREEGAVLGEKITTKTNTPKASSAQPKSSVHLSLANARLLPKGRNVIVQGVVIAPPGAFSEHYFYVADDSGGLQMYSSKKDLPALALGDRVKITGQISAAYGTPRLKIASAKMIDVLATAQPIQPEDMALEDIDGDSAGKLITVAGEITELKSNQLYLDDGETEGLVYLKTAAHIDRGRLKTGDNLRVTGIVEETKSGWQIWPRGNNDIGIVQSTTNETTKSVDLTKKNRQKYLIITLVGLSSFGLALWARRYFGKPR